MKLHKTFRDSNTVWHAMYYDELVDTPDYQLSYMKNTDRPYYNSAHSLQSDHPATLLKIEKYYSDRNLKPGIYLDPESPKTLAPMLLDRGYDELPSELEYWYEYSVTTKKPFVEESDSPLDFIFFKPHPVPIFDEFLKINALGNDLPDYLVTTLKHNLLNPKNPNVRFICGVAMVKQKIISTGLIGLYNDIAYLSEGATHPNFRRKGIYTKLRERCVNLASHHDCKKVIVNCDSQAYSNNAYKRLGFTQICSRQFFQKGIS